jgi:putative ABC transport system permease protein
VKQILARDQVRLGIARCLQLAWSGLGHRLFRSSVTIAILMLAVAFLAHMLAFGVLEQTTRRSAYGELSSERALGEVLTRATAPDSESTVLTALAEPYPSQHLAEYQRWSERSPAELAAASGAARQAQSFAEYLATLPPAARAALCGDSSPEELLVELREPERMQRFERALRQLGVRPPFTRSADPTQSQRELELLVLRDLPQAKQVAHAVVEGQRAALAKLKQTFGERSPAQMARDAPLELRAALGAAGFDLSRWSSQGLAAFARRKLAVQDLEKALLKGTLRAEVARGSELPISAVSAESVLAYVGDAAAHARWLSELLRRTAQLDIPPALLSELASSSARERALARAVGDAPPEQAYFLGISPQSRWLVALSFLVCAVGVANAMLMSVTERFSEIATMKCLGALDGFVMTMFLLEAAIEGGIGGAVGLALGALLAWLRALVEYGSVLSAAGAGGHLASGLGLAWLAGMLLAALAAVGPSFVAARLAPMEAMRVD